MRSFCLKGPDDVQVAEEPYPTTTMKMRSKVRAIDKIYKRRDRYEIPEWQRQKVWSRPKKQKLIRFHTSRLEAPEILLPENLKRS